MKLNPEKMEEHGFSFDSPDDLLLYASNLLEYFRYHNKNLTKTQDEKSPPFRKHWNALTLK